MKFVGFFWHCIFIFICLKRKMTKKEKGKGDGGRQRGEKKNLISSCRHLQQAEKSQARARSLELHLLHLSTCQRPNTLCHHLLPARRRCQETGLRAENLGQKPALWFGLWLNPQYHNAHFFGIFQKHISKNTMRSSKKESQKTQICLYLSDDLMLCSVVLDWVHYILCGLHSKSKSGKQIRNEKASAWIHARIKSYFWEQWLSPSRHVCGPVNESSVGWESN